MAIETEKSSPLTMGKIDKTPSAFIVMWREVRKDKMAMFSMILLGCILVFVYGLPLILNKQQIIRIDLFAIYQPPSANHWLGTDSGGRDILGQLIIGARNSFSIALAITLLTGAVGLLLGLIAGFFGSIADNIVMRLVDFFLSLPFLMLVIVFVTVVPKYNVITLVLVLSFFLWTGKARLIRSKTLAERELDYVMASKALGTPKWKIMLREVLPNLSSIIIVSLTLNLATNIGIASGLSYLGFGLPEDTPSLGTLVGYAGSTDVVEKYWWVWLPASLLILVMMLCINFVGQAIKRAADARQRLG